MWPISAATQILFLTGWNASIRMRKEVPEIGWGDFEVLRTQEVRCRLRSAMTGAETRLWWFIT